MKEGGNQRIDHTTVLIHPKTAGCAFACVSAASFWDVGISYRDSRDQASDCKFKSAASLVLSALYLQLQLLQ